MKVQNPIIGRARGSAGGMTFCKNYDKNVARAKAFEVSNPNTPSQQTQRNFFKEVSALTATFTEEQMRTLFPMKPKAMSRRNALSKQIAEDQKVVEGVKVIDFANIDTLGNASTMDFGTTTCIFEDDVLTITLDESVKANTVYGDNDAIFAIVNDTKGEILLSNHSIEVSVGDVDISAPANWETTDTIHAIPFITNSKDGQIYNVGFGTFGVIKRPTKKANS